MSAEKWLKGMKLTVAAVLSIALADLLGLKYSATAGIITVLSIQNTKKETLQVAVRRGLAFLCALAIAAFAYGAFGFTIPAFALYLFGFSSLCLGLGWTEAIAMDSVLITHFLAEKTMGPALLGNEVGLFLIGTGMGILANLHLRRREEVYDLQARRVEQLMRDVLKEIEIQLRSGECETGVQESLSELERELEGLQECAFQNRNNTLRRASDYETEYARMRARQTDVLRRVQVSVRMAGRMPKQAQQVAELIDRIEAEYDRDNTVCSLMEGLDGLFCQMSCEALPATREEFEARAVLFYLLKQLEEFLRLKYDFMMEFVGKEGEK